MSYDAVASGVNALTRRIRELKTQKVYVGITHDVPERLAQHEQAGKYDGRKYCAIECSDDAKAREVEKRLITNGISGIEITGGGGGGDTDTVFVYAFPDMS